MRRVAIIGVGLISGGGRTLDETWNFITAGKVNNVIQWPPARTGRTIALAQMAINQAIEHLPDEVPVDAICVGSTSAAFYENTHGDEKLIPANLMEELSEMYDTRLAFQSSQACASSSSAIALAVDLIRLGKADVVLAGGVDELTDCVVDAFKAARVWSDLCKPFDAKRDGTKLGEF